MRSSNQVIFLIDQTFTNMASALNDDGFMFISVPAGAGIHRYPRDRLKDSFILILSLVIYKSLFQFLYFLLYILQLISWRFYPDAGTTKLRYAL